jgi:hypothetical protein
MKYTKLISTMTKWLDAHEGDKYCTQMSEVLRIFRHESKYSKEPDTQELKLYENWARQRIGV